VRVVVEGLDLTSVDDLALEWSVPRAHRYWLASTEHAVVHEPRKRRRTDAQLWEEQVLEY